MVESAPLRAPRDVTTSKLRYRHLLALVPVIAVCAYVHPQEVGALLCFVAGAGALAFLYVKVVRALLAPTEKQHAAFLQACGFSPCTEAEATQLKATVAQLKSWRQPDGFYLSDPVKAEINGRTVFQYAFSDHGRPSGLTGTVSSRGAVREFEVVVPFARRSPEPVVVLLGASGGVGTRVQDHAATLGATMASRWSSTDRPYGLLDLSPDVAARGISNVLGPPLSSVPRLLSPDDLDVLARGSSAEVDSIVASDGAALLTFRQGCLTAAGYAALPAYLQALTSR